MERYATAVDELLEGSAVSGASRRSNEAKAKSHKYSTPVPGQQDYNTAEEDINPDTQPTQHEAMEAIKDSMARLNTKFKEPPPVLPQKSVFRGKPTFAHLESVAEETGSTGSKRVSREVEPSIADSVETVLHRPLDDDPGYEGSAGSSGSSERRSGGSGSNSSGRASYETPSTEQGTILGSPLKWEVSPVHKNFAIYEMPAVVDESGEHHLRRHDSKHGHQISDTMVAHPVAVSDMGQPEIETAELPGHGPPAPSVPVPGSLERDHRHKSRKKRGRSLITKQEPTVAAIDGMIESLSPPSKNRKDQPASKEASKAPHFSRPFSPVESTSGNGSFRQRPQARPQYYQTVRDGVPILMHRRSGVWVEAVEGVDLTTENKDADHMDPDDKVIPEQEAEEVRNIEVLDPRAAYPEYYQHDQDRSSAGDSRNQQSSDSGYGSSTMPARARQTSTERWAEDQAAMQQHQSQVCQKCNKRKTGDHHESTLEASMPKLPEEVCPYLYGSGPSGSVEGPSTAWSRPEHVDRQTNYPAVMSGAIPAYYRDGPGPSVRTQPVQRRSYVPDEVEAKIDLAAAEVEEVLYGGGMRSKQSMRFRELEEQLAL